MRVKLIRDFMQVTQGGEVQFANSDTGKQVLLLLKLHEEAEEIALCPTDPAEYADMIEVLAELARLNGVSWDDIEQVAIDKNDEFGGFRQGRYWISSRTLFADQSTRRHRPP